MDSIYKKLIEEGFGEPVNYLTDEEFDETINYLTDEELAAIEMILIRAVKRMEEQNQKQRGNKQMESFFKKPTKENPYAELYMGKWRELSDALSQMVQLLESDQLPAAAKAAMIPAAQDLCDQLKTEVFFEIPQKK